MGDRVLVTFKDNSGLTPAVYLHWGGSDAVAMVMKAAPTMRKGDNSYSAARFCAHACSVYQAPTGVGILDAPNLEDSETSHGDAGILVVDVDTGEMKGYHGYLADQELPKVEVFSKE